MTLKSKVHSYTFLLSNYIPIIISFLSILLSASLKSPSGFGMTLPMISIISVFYWSVYATENFTIRHVFILGFLSDILFNNPLGSGFLLLVYIREVSIRLSFLMPSSSYLMSWFLASVVFLNYFIINWIFFLIYYQSIPSIKYTVLQLLLTIAIYPFFMVIYSLIINYLKDK